LNRADWWLLGNSSWPAAVVVSVLTACLCACAPLPRYEVRPARSSLGCMRGALAAHGLLPAQDDQAHCLAAGLIARQCSITEAWLASLGKEVLDLLGPGDAEWSDLAADRRGISCARRAQDMAGLEACCKPP
jgi:hypothetical protein